MPFTAAALRIGRHAVATQRLCSLCLECRLIFSSPEMPRSSPAVPKEPASYELAMAELDRLVQQMEGGQLPLDELLDAYRRGAELLGFCRGRLQAVEGQVKLLEDGQLKPWDAE